MYAAAHVTSVSRSTMSQPNVDPSDNNRAAQDRQEHSPLSDGTIEGRSHAEIRSQSRADLEQEFEIAFRKAQLEIARDNGAAAVTLSERAFEIANALFSPRDYRWPGVHELLGDAYREAGKLMLAEAHYLECAKKRLATEQTDPYADALLQLDLGKVYEELGEFDQALSTLDRALELLDGLSGSNHVERASTLLSRARVMRHADRPFDANRALVDAYNAFRDLPQHRFNEAAMLLLSTGQSFLAHDMPQEAVMLLSEAKHYCDSAPSSQPTERRLILASLGSALHANGQFDDALTMVDAAHELDQRYSHLYHQVQAALNKKEVLRHLSPELYAALVAGFGSERSQLNLDALKGQLLIEKGELHAGERVLRAALDRAKSLFGEHDPNTIPARLNLASTLYSSFRVLEAETVIQEAFELLQHQLPERVRAILASEEQDRETMLVDYLRFVEPDQRAAALKTLSDFSTVTHMYGAILASKKERYPSQELFETSTIISAATVQFDADPEDRALKLAGLARIHQIQGNEAEARRFVEEAGELLDNITHAAPSRGFALAALGIGEVLVENGDLDQAGVRLEEACTILDQIPRTRDTYAIVPALVANAQYFTALNRFDDAEPLLIRALDILERRGSEIHPLALTSLRELTQIAKQKGDFDRADEYDARAAVVFNQLDMLNDFKLFGDLPGPDQSF